MNEANICNTYFENLCEVFYHKNILYTFFTIEAHFLQCFTLLSKTSINMSLTTKGVSFRNWFRRQSMKINYKEKW